MSGIAIPNKAIVLAAGLGKRMRPITQTIPKPLVRVHGRPLIDWVLDYVKTSGAQDVVVNTSYLAELLEAHLATRTSPKITISREEVPLETGGGILKALPYLGDAPFISTNSDAICIDNGSSSIARLAAGWQDDVMDAILLLQPVERAHGYEGEGDFFVDGSGKLRRRALGERAPYVFTGTQIMHPRLFTNCPEGPFSLNVLSSRSLDENGILQRVHGVVHDGDWLHVGDPEGLRQAEAFLETYLNEKAVNA